MRKRRINKKPFFILLILILLIFGALYMFKDDLKKNKNIIADEEDVLDKIDEKTISFTFAGNVLINNPMWYDVNSSDGYDFTYMFEYLNDIMKKSDINVYTEESIIGGSELGSTYISTYNTPKEILTTMKNIGFNVINVGTSHAFDKGTSGITNTISYLDEAELSYAGIGNNNVVEKDGLKIGFLSYTIDSKVAVTDSSVKIYSDETAKSDIESLNSDIKIVLIDWGMYESSEISEEQDRIVNYLSELGVNIIIGNNDAVIEPIKKVGNTLVCYSLGNLMSGHSPVDYRISAVVDFKLNYTNKNDEKTIEFSDINVLFTYAYNNDGDSYKVIPFSKITSELSNYSDYYTKYSDIIKGIDTINIYSIGE